MRRHRISVAVFVCVDAACLTIVAYGGGVYISRMRHWRVCEHTNTHTHTHTCPKMCISDQYDQYYVSEMPTHFGHVNTRDKEAVGCDMYSTLCVCICIWMTILGQVDWLAVETRLMVSFNRTLVYHKKYSNSTYNVIYLLYGYNKYIIHIVLHYWS